MRYKEVAIFFCSIKAFSVVFLNKPSPLAHRNELSPASILVLNLSFKKFVRLFMQWLPSPLPYTDQDFYGALQSSVEALERFFLSWGHTQPPPRSYCCFKRSILPESSEKKPNSWEVCSEAQHNFFLLVAPPGRSQKILKRKRCSVSLIVLQLVLLAWMQRMMPEINQGSLSRTRQKRGRFIYLMKNRRGVSRATRNNGPTRSRNDKISIMTGVYESGNVWRLSGLRVERPRDIIRLRRGAGLKLNKIRGGRNFAWLPEQRPWKSLGPFQPTARRTPG